MAGGEATRGKGRVGEGTPRPRLHTSRFVLDFYGSLQIISDMCR